MNRIRPWTVLVGVVCFALASCAGSPAPAPRTPAATAPAAGGSAAGTTAAPSQGGGFAASPVAMFSNTAPQGGAPVFFGMSNRLRNRGDEETAALLHAAEQAVRYQRIVARYHFVSQRTAGAVGYVEDIVVDWDVAAAESLIEQLEPVAWAQDNEGTYVLAKAAFLPAAPNIAVGRAQSGVPAWVNQPPAVAGYLVAVGVTQRSMRLRDSINNADQDALKGLLTQTGTTLRLIQDERTIDRVGTREMVTAAQEARAAFQQFYVAARYLSADGRYFYSLAVARETE